LEDRRISAKSIAEQLGISRERAGFNIQENWDMRKLSATWVPKCLNADQKRPRCQSSEQLTCLGFQCLDHSPYSPDLAPSDYHLIPGLKNNRNAPIFRTTRRSLLPRRPGWTDNILNFLKWLAKFIATG
jgi:hypothetical protein